MHAPCSNFSHNPLPLDFPLPSWGKCCRDQWATHTFPQTSRALSRKTKGRGRRKSSRKAKLSQGTVLKSRRAWEGRRSGGGVYQHSKTFVYRAERKPLELRTKAWATVTMFYKHRVAMYSWAVRAFLKESSQCNAEYQTRCCGMEPHHCWGPSSLTHIKASARLVGRAWPCISELLFS